VSAELRGRSGKASMSIVKARGAREARVAELTKRRDKILLGFRRMDVHYLKVRDELRSLEDQDPDAVKDNFARKDSA
jgi:hypothetical protein